MKKTLVTILITLVLTLALIGAGLLGFQWYRNNHVFVEKTAYPIDAVSLDLREEDISFDHFDSLQSQLPNCEILWMVPFHGGKYASNTESLLVSDLTLEDVELLVAYFPKLKTLDAMQCEDYEVLAVAEATLPECEVLYDVDLGGPVIDHKATALVTGFGETDDFDQLLANLAYLPELQSLTLKAPALSPEQVETLREAYPEVTIDCIVELLGKEYDAATTKLDLSAMESSDVAELVEKLPLLPGLERVDLTNENGESKLTKTDVKLLQEAAPNVVFQYSFDFYGVTLSTADEAVHIKNTRIGDQGEEEIRQALDILTNCKRFVLEYCSVSNEVMAQIREDYRERTKVVWRVHFGKGSTLTDAEAIRAVYDLTDDNCQDLIYCEDARYIDIGHNEFLDGVPFVAGMPNLEVIIISGAPVKDLTPFANCKKLRILEAAFCECIYDITPLAGCESLEMLNISYTHVTDLSPLDDLNLTRLTAMYYPKSRVPQEEQDRFTAANPDCTTYFVGDQPYGKAWRYDADNEYLDWYRKVREVFSYDTYPQTPNHTGWYL